MVGFKNWRVPPLIVLNHKQWKVSLIDWLLIIELYHLINKNQN